MKMRSVAGLQLPPWPKCHSVSRGEFEAAFFEDFTYSSEYHSRYEEPEFQLFFETNFQGTDEQLKFGKNSAIWRLLEDFYFYAEMGINPEFSFSDDDFMWAIEFLTHLHSLKEWHGIGSWALEKIVYKAFARIKLDSHLDVDGHDDFPTLSSGFLPLAHTKHFTMLEVALLAGVSNVRSIRNATYDKNAPLATIKEGGSVLVTVDEARQWLATRPKFIPTQGVDYD
ncbi:hypothetical protein [Vibrio sp. MA40-2]|uniref:hypothetical protein n=1 Tax=Vibrio sp. MA40-2 TaxID=3391828 RepID=UPI0039A6DCF9